MVDIYDMHKNHESDDAMYRVMQSYTTIGLEKIHNTNKRYVKEYEQHLNEKARMDMRVGSNPKNSPTADRSLRRRHGRNQWKRGC